MVQHTGASDQGPESGVHHSVVQTRARTVSLVSRLRWRAHPSGCTPAARYSRGFVEEPLQGTGSTFQSPRATHGN